MMRIEYISLTTTFVGSGECMAKSIKRVMGQFESTVTEGGEPERRGDERPQAVNGVRTTEPTRWASRG